jgi:hypothetical protein
MSMQISFLFVMHCEMGLGFLLGNFDVLVKGRKCTESDGKRMAHRIVAASPKRRMKCMLKTRDLSVG